MNSTDRALKLSDEFDRVLKKVAADCLAFEGQDQENLKP